MPDIIKTMGKVMKAGKGGGGTGHNKPGPDQATFPSAANIVTDHDTVPNFANAPNILSIRSGNWSSNSTWNLNRVPTTGDVVGIKTTHTVTYDVSSTDAIKAVGVAGKLAFVTNANTKLTVQHFLVYGPQTLGSGKNGELEIGTAAVPIGSSVTAQIVISDVALDGSDTNQYGNGIHIFGKARMHGAIKTPFVRMASNLSVGGTSITFGSAVSGWAASDRVMIPDSRIFITDGLPFQDEVATLSAVAGDNLSATTGALTYAHAGWKDSSGTNDPAYYPHAFNLTRNIIFKSENASGVRGHFMAHAVCDLDCRYVRFDSLGRTRWVVVLSATNKKGRYCCHLHHVTGPTAIPASGYQYVVKGCVMEETDSEQRKWGITMHDSHYGLIQDNVVYRYGGASLYSEQGNESYNVIDGNCFARSDGTNTRGDDQYNGGEPGKEGMGLWLAGMNNYARNNVSVNHINASYGIYSGDNPEGGSHTVQQIPAFQGADPDVDYTIPVYFPILQFLNNECYSSDQGINQWFTGTNSGYVTVETAIGQSVIEGLKAWHMKRVTFMYPSNKFKFLNCSFRGDYTQLQFNTISQQGIIVVDYMQRNQQVVGCTFKGLTLGVGVCVKVGDSRDSSCDTENIYLIQDCSFDCQQAIYIENYNAVTGGGSAEAPRRTEIRNCTMTTPSVTLSQAAKYLTLNWLTNESDRPHYNWVLADSVYVYDYQGSVGTNYRMWWDQQDGAFVTPQTTVGGSVGSPDAGKTNTQNLADNGVCVMGAIRPTVGLTSLTKFDGQGVSF